MKGAGVFIYPLAFAWFAAFFVILDRLLTLPRLCVIPPFDKQSLEKLLAPNLGVRSTILQRILRFQKENRPDVETLESFMDLEISCLERGFYVLEIVISAAPLLGLLGTVTGLIQVFSGVSSQTAMPEPTTFVSGISLAMTTTMLGLLIAIPTIIAHSYFTRRVTIFCSQIRLYVSAMGQLLKEKNGR